MENGTGTIKEGKSDHEEVQIFEEDNYWKHGYNMRLCLNNSNENTFIMSHSNLDFRNGL